MPNGNYNQSWCEDKHREINSRMNRMDHAYTSMFEKLDRRLWGLALLALTQVIGFLGLIITLVYR